MSINLAMERIVGGIKHRTELLTDGRSAKERRLVPHEEYTADVEDAFVLALAEFPVEERNLQLICEALVKWDLTNEQRSFLMKLAVSA